VVMDLPASYFLVLCTGEVFISVDAALTRLNGYALTQGFAVVKTGGTEYSAATVPIEEELGDTIKVVLGTPPPIRGPSTSLEPLMIDLPPSTAPVRVEGARSKRARAISGYYSALQAGDL
jgi:hypothetical protein